MKLKRIVMVLCTFIMILGMISTADLTVFAAESITVDIPVSVSAECYAQENIRDFTLVLNAKDISMPMPSDAVEGQSTKTLTCKTVNGSTEDIASGVFTIVYSRPGIYQYTISQIADEKNPGCDYDESVYSVVVHITNKAGGGFESTVAVHMEGDNASEKQEESAFHNKYAKPEDKPDETEKPADPETPESNENDDPSEVEELWDLLIPLGGRPGAPKTGDEAQPLLLLLILAACVAAVAILVIKKKRG